MSRRRKSGPIDTTSKDQKADNDDDKLTMNDSKVEWSDQEKRRLLDALKKDEGKNNWRWIARQVKTRTTAQVKDFASKLGTEKQASNKRPIAPKDDSPLEAWINVTKRLRGDSDVDGTCIPQIMTIAAMEPVQPGDGEASSPDYSQIYTLLGRVMRGQPPPDLTPLSARVILDLMADLDRRLAGHDISSQVNFITNKYKEVMQSQDTALSSEQTQVPSGQAEAACSTSDPGPSSSGKPKTPLSSLNPLNVPVKLLNLKKSTPVSSSQS